MDRYSLAVELSHLFLHAGLSRRTTFNEVLGHPRIQLNAPDGPTLCDSHRADRGCRRQLQDARAAMDAGLADEVGSWSNALLLHAVAVG